jgi:hypothetical protein
MSKYIGSYCIASAVNERWGGGGGGGGGGGQSGGFNLNGEKNVPGKLAGS